MFETQFMELKLFQRYVTVIDGSFPKTLFHFEDFESSKFLSLIGEDTIISEIGPLSLAQSNDSKSSMWKSV